MDWEKELETTIEYIVIKAKKHFSEETTGKLWEKILKRFNYTRLPNVVFSTISVGFILGDLFKCSLQGRKDITRQIKAFFEQKIQDTENSLNSG